MNKKFSHILFAFTLLIAAFALAACDAAAPAVQVTPTRKATVTLPSTLTLTQTAIPISASMAKQTGRSPKITINWLDCCVKAFSKNNTNNQVMIDNGSIYNEQT